MDEDKMGRRLRWALDRYMKTPEHEVHMRDTALRFRRAKRERRRSLRLRTGPDRHPFWATPVARLAVILFACLAVAGCLRLQRAFVPDGPKRPVAETVLEEASSTSCRNEALTGNVTLDMELLLRQVEDYRMRLVKRRVGRGATSLRYRILLPPDFYERTPHAQVRLLAHELYHRCQRGQMGDTEFELTWAETSEGTLLIEAPAFREALRVGVLQGWTREQTTAWVDEKVPYIVDRYLLQDLEGADAALRTIFAREVPP